jgi:hypothetical protein
MDRPIVIAAGQTAEQRLRLPFDLDEDYGDDSIYSMSYRSRTGVVVTDRVVPEPDVDTPEEAAVRPAVARS